jgi:hypothetical protein
MDVVSCSWPRRLLHVETLVVYTWEPNNTYNGISQPAYAAVSYTWGRYKLEDHEEPDVPRLSVTGVSWPIPRVRSSHFTTTTFHTMLKNICEHAKGEIRSKFPTGHYR